MLKTGLVHHRTYATHEQAKPDRFVYVEGFYNHQRLGSGMGYWAPATAEQKAQSIA